MRNGRILLLLICVIVPFAAMMAWAQTTLPMKAPGTKLAVIDIRQVYESLDEKVDLDRSLETARSGFMKELDRQKAEIERLSVEMEKPTLYRRGSPEFLKQQDDLLQKSSDLQSNTQVSQQKLFIQLHGKALEIHRHINEAIAEYARSNDLAIVFVASELDIAAARTPQELDGFPSMRKLAYFHPAYDITRAITERMNTAYKIGPAAR